MHAKVCPRCGAQYQNLKSTTCPQCFAVLVPVDDATAEELSAARAEVERSPEFQEVKAADDERFKEQSFGACLAVVAMTVLTLVFGIVLFVSAARRHSPPTQRVASPPALSSPTAPSLWAKGVSSSLPTLPVAAATLDEVLPPSLGPYVRQARDRETTLTATLTPLFHAVYAAPGAPALDVYALPAGRPTAESNQFRLGMTLAAQVSHRPLLFFPTEYWQFAVLAAPGDPAAPSAFRDALLTHFGG